MGGPTVIAFVVLVSFAVDRIVAGILFGLSWWPRWRALVPDPAEIEDPRDRASAQRAEKTAYFALAGALGAILLAFVGGGILEQLGLTTGPYYNRFVDILLSALILMGGAEQVSKFSGSLAGSGTPVVTEPPVRISGTLTLEEGTLRRLRGEIV